MIEVEAKVAIRDPAIVRAKVRTLGTYTGVEHKVDDYYTLQGVKTYPSKSLRIRNHDGRYEVNFKQKLNHIHRVHAKNEVEFTIGDIDRFLLLIKEFGFKKWLRKEKKTELYEVSPQLHIELNQVTGLGWFIEIEALCQLSEVQRARAQVLALIHTLGYTEKDIILKGYTKLLWDKNH